MLIRRTVLAAVATMALTCAAASAEGLKTVMQIKIEPQPVSAALLEFSDQTKLQVVSVGTEVRGLQSPGVEGEWAAGDALTRLLEGTGLGFELISDNTVRIFSSGEARRASGAHEAGAGSSMRLAQADSPAAESGSSGAAQDAETQQSAAGSAENSQDAKLEEIVVTAQKRVERLQDVPVPVTALDAESLVDSHQLRLQDYYTKVPGLNLTLFGDGSTPQITIRGITTGAQTNPTVGIVVDDIPYGSSTSVGGFFASDIDPSELARVEVLRGPQGTLYGASSLGGLVKYVTVDPSTDRVSGRVQAGLTGVENGDETGYNVRGAVNVPLSDTWAMRASAYKRREPGYVDNVQTGENGVNRIDAEGGRLAALWRPSETFSLKLSALMQHAEANGSAQVHVQPGLGDLQQRSLPETGGYDRKVQAYSATIKANLGSAELTSLSGYSIDRIVTRLDGSRLLSFLTPASISRVATETEKFTQELRLAMPIGERVDWLLGAFYTDEEIPAGQDIFAVNPTTGAVVSSLFSNHGAAGDGPFKFSEYAAFTNVTFHVTDRFDVQLGGRGSRHKRTEGRITSVGPLLGPSGIAIAPQVRSENDAFTYLLTPQFKVSPDLMVYARLASGYRPGGPNVNSVIAAGAPPEFDADTTQNVEIGVKGALLNHALTYDASLYYIDWKDIQLQLRDPVSLQIYNGNGSRAKSQGLELSLESKPLRGFTVAAWAVWNTAELTEDIPFPPPPPPPASNTPPVFGASGDRLPYSSRFSGNLSIDQEFPLGGTMTGFVGSSVSYIGDRVGILRSVATLTPLTPLPRQTHPSYTQIDLRAGLRYDTWTVNAFINNLADKRGVLRGGLDRPAALNFVFDYIQPRTMGLSLAKTF